MAETDPIEELQPITKRQFNYILVICKKRRWNLPTNLENMSKEEAWGWIHRNKDSRKVNA